MISQMILKRFIVIKKIILVSIIGYLAYIIEPITISKQMPLYDLLIQISSIILAISGAWIAVIFPESFKNILLYKNNYKNDFESISLLVNVVIGSLYILVIILLLKLTGLVLYHIEYMVLHKVYIQKISLFVLIILYLYEIWILLITIFPIKNTFNKARKENIKNNIIDKRHNNMDKNL